MPSLAQRPIRLTQPPRPSSATPRNPIAEIYGHAVYLLLPLALLALALGSLRGDAAAVFNTFAPLYFTAVIILSGYRVARTSPAALWSPAFWLLASTGTFFGLGPMVEIFGAPETLARIAMSNMAISQEELFAANRLSYVCTLALFAGFWLHTLAARQSWLSALNARTITTPAVFSAPTLATAFVVFGMLFVHGALRPAEWGQLDIVVPGSLASIGAIVDAGFALAAYLAARGSTGMRLLFVLLWPLHLFLVALSFSKAGLIIALTLPAVGYYLANRSLRWLAASFFLLLIVYTYSQDFTNYGRSEIWARSGTIWRAGYDERVEIVQRYFSSSPSPHAVRVEAVDEVQGWWMRLNYAPVQAIAMDFRERGVFINSMENAAYLFIPRIIWPDKPIYVGPGKQFYELVTGNSGVFLGLSVYGDVYWQFGWLGVLLIMPLIGWGFAMTAWRSIKAVAELNFIWMPLVLLSITISAGGLAKFLVNGIIAAIPIYLAYLLLIVVAERVVRGGRSRARPRPPAALGPRPRALRRRA